MAGAAAFATIVVWASVEAVSVSFLAPCVELFAHTHSVTLFAHVHCADRVEDISSETSCCPFSDCSLADRVLEPKVIDTEADAVWPKIGLSPLEPLLPSTLLNVKWKILVPILVLWNSEKHHLQKSIPPINYTLSSLTNKLLSILCLVLWYFQCSNCMKVSFLTLQNIFHDLIEWYWIFDQHYGEENLDEWA